MSRTRFTPQAWWYRTQRNLPFYLLALLLMVGLKIHYSRAASNDLVWILGPTAAVVEWLGGGDFYREIHAGYLRQDGAFLIAPACAGVNFLIMVFGTTVWTGLPRFRNWRAKLGWLVTVAAAAYLTTVGVNALRIRAAIALAGADLHGAWLTPQRVHRLAGMVVFLPALCLFYLLSERLTAGAFRPAAIHRNDQIPPRPGRWRDALPLFWYWAVGLGIPLARAAWHRPNGLFWEHAATLLLGGAMTLPALFGLRGRRTKPRAPTRSLESGPSRPNPLANTPPGPCRSHP